MRVTPTTFLLLAAVLAVLTACSDSHDGPPACDLQEAPCEAGFVEWTDERCWEGDGSAEPICDPFGDGLCYRRCVTDANCTDPCHPHCEELAFYRGGPRICSPPGEIVMVCRNVNVGSCDL